jgi:hypothetical protein
LLLKKIILAAQKKIPAAHFCCQKSNVAAQKKYKNVAVKKVTLLPKVTNLLPILQIAYFNHVY